MPNKPLELKRKDVIVVMREIGMSQFCQQGQGWIKNIAPDILERKLFTDTESDIHGYLSFFIYCITDDLHIPLYNELAGEKDGWTFIDMRIANWNRICRTVAKIAKEINERPTRTDALYRSDVYALIRRIGRRHFCEAGITWLSRQDKEITKPDIVNTHKPVQYLSYFVHIIQEALYFRFDFDWGESGNEWLLSKQNLSDEAWAYICGTVWGLARRYEFERTDSEEA